MGSGFIVQDSIALTAAHVISGHQLLIVRRHGQDELPACAYVLPSGSPAVDEEADLALLKITEAATLRSRVDFARLFLDVTIGPSIPENIDGCWG